MKYCCTYILSAQFGKTHNCLEQTKQINFFVFVVCARDCDFSVSFYEEAVRDQVVAGTKDKALSETLQLTHN